jgi:hypothetical protein
LRELRRRINTYTASEPYTMVERHEPNGFEMRFLVRLTRPPSPRWDAIVADCLHNYRAVLDHTIWALTERHGTPNGRRCFPIYLTRDDFRKHLKREVGDTGRSGAKAVIERFQPYKGSMGNHDPLWFLHELDRYAKHRRLGGIEPQFVDSAFDVLHPGGEGVACEGHFDALDRLDGVERYAAAFHVIVRSHAVGEVEVQFTPRLRIMFLQPHLEHRGPVPLLPILASVQRRTREVVEALQPICEQP